MFWLKCTSAILGSFLIFGIRGQAQPGSKADFRIEWGPELNMSGDYPQIGFVGNREHGLIRITEQVKKEVVFERLGPDLKSTGELKREWLPSSPNIVVERVLDVDGHTYVLVSDYDAKADVEKLLLYEVDAMHGGFKAPVRELIKTAGKVEGRWVYTGTIRFSTTDKFKVDVLPDGKHIVVYYCPKSDKKKPAETDDLRVYHVFDRSWNLLWSQEVTLPYPEAGITPLAHRVVDNDIVLFAGLRSGSKSEAYDRVSIFHIRRDAGMQEHPLVIDGSVVFDLMAGESGDKYLFLTGYTGPNVLSPYRTGFFTALFNTETFTLDDVSLYPFEEEMMSMSTNGLFNNFLEDLPEGQRKGVPYLQVKKMLPRPGGGWFVIGEQFKTYEEHVQTEKGSAIIEHLLYQDIWVTALDEEMTPLFSRRIPKKQHTRSKDFWTIGAQSYLHGGSFSAFMYKNDLYLFYLDLMENRALENPNLARKYEGPKGAAFICSTIDPEGKVNHLVLHEIDLHNVRKLILPLGMKELEPGVWASTGLSFRESLYPAIIRLGE